MIIAAVYSITYIPNDREHTVYYANQCRALESAFSRRQYLTDTFQAVVACDKTEALDMLRHDIAQVLANVAWGPALAKDWKFSFHYEEVVHQHFWRGLHTISKQYPVAGN